MNVVIKVNDEIKKKMIEYYKDKVRDKKIPYVVFQAQEEDTVITMYESGKVMFQGVSADVDAAMWGTALENTKEKQAERKKENALVGKYVNLAYPLPNGRSIQFLNDETTYLGNELESQFGGSRCFGILANMDFILVCTYEAGGANPELVLYKKR